MDNCRDANSYLVSAGKMLCLFLWFASNAWEKNGEEMKEEEEKEEEKE